MSGCEPGSVRSHPHLADLPSNFETVVVRLAAEANISFSTITEQQILRLLIEGLTGRKLPRSPNTIKRIVYEFADSARTVLSRAFERYQRHNGSFALVFDEATASNSFHRYLSLSVRTENVDEDEESDIKPAAVFFLGLILVQDSSTVDLIATVIRARLALFRIAIENC